VSRGKKLDIFIGADIQDGWSKVEQIETKQQKLKLKPHEHALKFIKEKRRGKTVTLVGEFFISNKEIKQMLKDIKSQLGCGGTCKDGYIELQGDVQDLLKAKFKKLGFN